MKRLLCLFIALYPFVVFAESEEDLAYKYAPVIFQSVDESEPALDFVAGVDFDGDMTGNNNWEDALEFKLLPVIYFAVVSTETHHFITYSIFHPRDWTTYCTGLFYECHENDMENLQIVVDRASEEVVALVTQAHMWSSIYLSGKSSEGDGRIIFVNGDGEVDSGGRAGVFVESGGHGIYGLADKSSGVTVGKKYVKFSDGPGVVYYPDKFSNIVEPEVGSGMGYPYRLESTLVKFWEPVLRGELYGEGKLFNGTFNYSDPNIAWNDIPRHFDSNMMSGIGKYSSGIVPFAMGFSLFGSDVGGLFFNPAYHFRRKVTLAQSWSENYTYNPYK